ncbi:MAG: amino acid adenylation domain-containing protein, partial [Xanthomonadales bacterium]|nr:amino acid adenylation domain-containing protein [Xanthomonadales bacterium]
MNNIEDMYALSPLQEGLLFHTVAEPDSSAYHQQMVIELQGSLEPELLQQAWHNTIARHAILRACYVWEQLDAPLQVIQQSIQSPIQWEHWTAESNTNAEAWEARLEALITSEQQQTFSLLQAPLMRLRVMQVAEQRAFLIWTYHHLIIDGWSSGLLLSEWLHSYQQLQQGVAIDALQLDKAPNFRRYIAWLQQQDQNQAQAFWQQQLNQWQGVTPLPLAKTNPTAEAAADHPYGEQNLQLSTQFTKDLNDFSRRHKVTLNTLAQAAWACVLQAHSNSDDVLFGSTTHGRPASLDGADDMVGLFINTLPLRVQVQAQQSLISLLQQLQEQNSDMRQFDYISPAQIRQWCQHQEEQWFQSILVFENFPIDAALDQLAGDQSKGSASSEGHGGSGATKALSARVHHSIERVSDENGIEAFVHRGRNHFPLTLVWIPGEQAEIAISYQLQHYSHQAAQLLLKQYQSVLQHMLADAEQSINQLALQQQDQTDIGLAGDTLAVNDWLDEVRQHIQQQPDHIAVVDAHGALSYGQLDQNSNQLAQVLGSSIDGQNKAEIGSVVAIIADRSNAMMTALLASLKAGFAYVLIDPSLPQARIESLIRDSAARWIVSTVDELPSFDHADVTALPQFILARDGRLDAAHNPALVLSELPQHAPNIQVPAETLAYLIYTSGSTGAPKAVMVPRRALANYSAGFLARHGEHLGEQVATMATVAADLGNTQLFATLAAGKTLHLLSYDCIHDPDAVASYMHEHSIDSLKIVPSHLQGLLAAAQAQQVLPRCSLILGGEATSPALLKQLRELAPALRLINHYGPSETTVGICSHSVESSDSAVDFPLGLPFANTQLLVLDEQLEPVATGQRGELYVRGPALAHGYLGQARQSALAFIPDPFGKASGNTGQRLYKTGDAVRQRADGRLEYLGRVDQQVKIRGYRVEPLELEQRLRQLCLESETASAESIIGDIAVAAQNATHNTLQGESKQLVAYVMNPQGDSAELQTHLEQLQQRLSQQLPDYLLPSRWMVLEAFPLNANGKLDRRQLPQPSAMETATAVQNSAAQKVLPRNPVEAALAAIWQEVLNVDGEMGIHDDFFSLGGDSILNLQIIARANRQGIKLTPKQLFEHKTIAEIAAVANVVNPDLRDDNDTDEQTAATNQLPISSAQAHYLQHEQVHQLSRWRWFHCQDMQWTQLQAAWQQLLHNYPVLRSRFSHNEQNGWQCTLSDVEQATQLSRCTRDTEKTLAEQASQWQAEHGLSRVDQALIAACAICSVDDDESINALIIRVHPLVMDDSQWDELVDHLHGFYRDPQDQRHVEAVQYQDWLSALPAAALSEKIKASSNTKASQSLSTALFAQAPKADYTELLRKHRLQWSQLLAYALQHALQSDAFQAKSLNTQGFSLQLSQRPQTHFDVPKPEHSEHDAFGNHRYSRVLGCFEQAVVVPHLSIDQSDTDLLQQLRQHKVNLYQQIHSGRWFKQDASAVGLSVSESIATRTEHLQEASPRLSETTVLSDEQQLHVHLQVDNAEANSTQVSLHSQAALEVFDNHQLQQLHQSIEQQLHHILKRLVELTPSPAALVDFPLLALRDTRAMDTTLDEVQLDWANVADLYPLSPMQEGLLLHTLLRPNSGIYLMQQYYHWQGELNEDLLSQAWSVLLQRYPVLRTGFYSQGEGQPIQVVYRQQANPVQFYDWRDKNRSEQESAMEAMLAEERTQGYDMQNGPLTRLRVVRISDDRYDIMRSFHHVLTDAWCFSLLMMDFMAIYEGMLAGREIHLSPPRPYRDYIAWLERQDKASAEQFWRDYLHDFITPTPLALAAPAHDEGQYGIDNHQLEVLSKAETQQLNALAQSCQVTPNTFLQAAWILLLSYYSGERDIVVGVTTSGRPADMEGVEEIFGLFINSLPLRIEINAQDKLKDWAKVLLDENIKTRQYEYTPLVDIQRLSQVSKGEEIFQSLIVFENAPIDAALDEERDQFNVDRGKDRVHTNYPITVVGYPGDELGVRLSYETQKFSAKAVNQMLQHLMQLLRQMLAQPEATLGELNPLSDKEQQQLQHWAHSEHQFPVAECWQLPFEQQVAQQADAAAVS